MDICEGGDLFETIKNSNIFSERTAAKMMKQILSAVVYLHNNGFVHRDLNP